MFKNFAPYIAFFALVAPCLSQQTSEPTGRGRILVRASAVELFDEVDSVLLRAGERELGELKLSDAILGPRTLVPARQFSCGTFDEEGNFKVLATVNLPERGQSFVLVFVPTKNGYRVFPIQTDDGSFRGNDAMVFNFTNTNIGVKLGDGAGVVAPMKHARVRPIVPEREGVYTASFFYERDGQPVIFRNGRWPMNSNLKSLVFVYAPPGASAPTYRQVMVLANEKL